MKWTLPTLRFSSRYERVGVGDGEGGMEGERGTKGGRGENRMGREEGGEWKVVVREARGRKRRGGED